MTDYSIRHKLASDVSRYAHLKSGLKAGVGMAGLLGLAGILNKVLRRGALSIPEALSEPEPGPELSPDEQYMKDLRTKHEVENAVREFDWNHSPPGRNLR
jgi:hypothetical protein